MIYGFGDRLRYIRSRRKMTQERLAKRIGVEIGTVSCYERTLAVPSVETFYNLCIVLQVNSDYMLGLDRKLLLLADGIKIDQLKAIKDYVEIIRSNQIEI